MTLLRTLLSDDHRHCDDLFAAAESAVSRADWPAATAAFAAFRAAVERHLAAEESELFPAFEAATGTTMGPTRVMRADHQEMRALLADIASAVAAHDADDCGGLAETLLIMMQQHNLKEENVLYPMCDDHLGARAEVIATGLRAALVEP